MINCYQYLQISEEGQPWGLSVLNAGCTRIKANQEYPFRHHPDHYYFNWCEGRVLDEYQVIYIVSGEGVFESSSIPERIVHPGTVILLFPGEWHRFRPAKKTGWEEYWVGFKGDLADNVFKRKFFETTNAMIPIGFSEELIRLFSAIIQQTNMEQPGFQPFVSGLLLHLLGFVYSLSKQLSFRRTDGVKSKIDQAITLLHCKIDEVYCVQEIAGELNVSYAWFRKWFKLYTGLPPRQYMIQLKIEKAKALLTDPSNSIKEICFLLRFEHPFYFSRLFKDKVGVSPALYRRQVCKFK